MSEFHWIWVTAAANVPPREGRAVEIAGRALAIFNLGDRFLAIDNACPHKGGPLSDGIIAGGAVVCPLHAWKIDLRTGLVERPANVSSCVTAYPTRVDGAMIVVGLPARFLERDASSTGAACGSSGAVALA
jgi:nitrite reductase (NADH) small subunit